MIFTLPITDIERIVELFSNLLDPRTALSIFERKVALIDAVVDLIDADVYVWNLRGTNDSVKNDSCGIHLHAEPTLSPRPLTNSTNDDSIESDSSSTEVEFLADQGWSSESQRRTGLAAMLDPAFAAFLALMGSPSNPKIPTLTWRREDYIDDETWDTDGNQWLQTGLLHSLFSNYRLPAGSISCLSFHRVATKPPFSERDKAIVATVIGRAEWLHLDNEYRTNATTDFGSKLARREQQVLVHLLRGKHKRDIAELLSISEHTVGDYVKSIYKHFAVSSRAELQALYMFPADSSEARARLNLPRTEES